MKGFGSRRRPSAVVIGLVAAGVAGIAAAGYFAWMKNDGVAAESEVAVRRLSPDQYRRTIADVFGPTIEIGGRFDPGLREFGLLEVGSASLSVTASAFEQYDGMARTIASQVVDDKHRGTLIPCKPKSAQEPDEACAGQFLADVGRLLYRRPLTQDELQSRVKATTAVTETVKDFYQGLGLGLASLLTSPDFLFRYERAEPDPDRTGQFRLDAYSKASRLSFFLWNASPDLMLLDAAEKGELNTKRGMARQVDRLLASPRLADGVRAFFADMFRFDEFDTLSKDAVLYPRFTPEIARDAPEQTLRTVADHLVVRHGDYRDLFTTRKTFMTPILGTLYRVPIFKDGANGSPDDWQPYEFSATDPHAGILSQVSFVALHSHPGRSSPTIRGKALREVVLCQKVPDPPGNVNFDLFNDPNSVHRTARERLSAHATNPVCAGCHKIMDPVGLTLENFDGAGQFQMTEGGEHIDAGGELDGIKVADAVGLGRAVHDNPATSSCLVNKLSAYAVGRPVTKGGSEWMKALEAQFAKDGYKVPDLMRQIALSTAFSRVSAPDDKAADHKLAAN